ncbi:MAG: hypothetical protein IIB88_08995 [Chloroflexi bacterium]|nr:hypothetical protein [Chloroflexota bacterium]
MEHIRVLSSEIGTRVAGSPQEDAAATYASDQFLAWGYDVEVQDFQAQGADLQRHATLTVEGPEGVEFIVAALFGSRSGEARGRLLDAGTGQPDDVPADASNAIVLIQRDDVPFLDMANRALEAGAAGVLIVNKEPGRFPGVLEPAVDIIAAVCAMTEGNIPAAVNCDTKADGCNLNIVTQPQEIKIRYALSCSYTYGGQTAAVVLKNSKY